MTGTKQQITAPLISLELNSRKGKTGSAVMQAFLFGAWLMTILWYAVSVTLFYYNKWWGALILFCTVAFTVYLISASKKLMSNLSRTFRLVMFADGVYLTSQDNKSRDVQTIRWRDVKWAEFYNCKDLSSVILRGYEKSVEIPVWAFSTRKEEILDVIQNHHVPLMRVP